MLTSTLTRPFPQARRLALDIETTGLDAWAEGAAVTALAVSDGDAAVVFDLRPWLADAIGKTEIGDWLTAHILDRECALMHNAVFDLPWLAHHFGVGYPKAVFDTLIGEGLLIAGLDAEDENGIPMPMPLSRSLEATAKRRLGVVLDKSKELQQGFKLDTVWTPEVIAYAANDVAHLPALADVQASMHELEGLGNIANIEMRCVPIFAEMVRRGVVVDRHRLIPLIEKAKQDAAKAEKLLQGVLSVYIEWERMKDADNMRAEFDAWQEKWDEAQENYANHWKALAPRDDAEKEDIYQSWRSARFRFNAEGLASITDKQLLDMLDTKTPKGRDIPAGQQRYVRRMMQLWRRMPENAKPPTDFPEIKAPLNMRSIQQKTIAVQAYIRDYNKINGTTVKMPEDFKRRTLVDYGLDCPQRIFDEIISPLMDFTKADKLVSSFGEPLFNLLRGEGEPEITVTTREEEVTIYVKDEDGEIVLWDGVPIVEEVFTITYQDTIKTYPREVLHGGWNQLGTATGRPSCSRPNLLQMPSAKNAPDFRRCFRARPGHVFIIADFSQIELRLLAQMSQDENLIDAFFSGKDLHLLTAAAIYGVDMENVTKAQRDTAKIVNFGICYGMGPQGLRRNLAGWKIRITQEEAETYLGKWRETYPRAAAFLREAGNRALNRRSPQGFTYAETTLGRRRYFDLPRGRELDRATMAAVRREGANHPIQGGNADVTKLAMVLIAEALTPLDGAIILQVYDELVAEVPEAWAWEAHALVQDAMQVAAEAVLTLVPAKVDCIVSPSWAEDEALAGPLEVAGVAT